MGSCPVPLLGGSGLRSRGTGALQKAERGSGTSPASSPMPRLGLKVRAGRDTPRPTAALTGPAPASQRGSGLTAPRLPHPPAREHMWHLALLGRGTVTTNSHRIPGPDGSTAAPPTPDTSSPPASPTSLCIRSPAAGVRVYRAWMGHCYSKPFLFKQ